MTYMNFLPIIPLFAGLLSGLIINYLADVLPETRWFSRPACGVCQTEYSIKDYLLHRRCAHGHKRSARTWLVLFLTVLSSLYIWFNPPDKLGYIVGMLLSTYFGLVFVIDLEHRLILHPTSLFGVALGLSVGMIKRGFVPTVQGAAAGLLIMLFFYYMGVLFAKFRAKRMLAAGQEPDDEEALGSGDVILVTILGLILGWPVIWFGLLTGILLGGFISLCLLLWLIASGQYNKNALMMFIPYGPYLITSAYLIVFFRDFVSGILSGQ